MAKRKNIDLRANAGADSNNMLRVRVDVSPQIKADYTATVTAAVTKVDLGGDYDGDELDLPAASYAVTSNGAAALKAALMVLLEGLYETLTVTYNDLATDTLVVTVTGCLVPLKNLNATAFTESNHAKP